MPAVFKDILFQLDEAKIPDAGVLTRLRANSRYICDVYCASLQGYKPPHCTRVIIRPAHFGRITEPRKTGSIISIAPYFDTGHLLQMERMQVYQYLLITIHQSMQQLSQRFKWDDRIFERAFQRALLSDCRFEVDYPVLLSPQRKESAHLRIEKTEELAAMYAVISAAGETIKIKLLEKPNRFGNDCSYVLARFGHWFDGNRFGLDYPRGKMKAWYALNDQQITCTQDDVVVEQFDFAKVFWLQG